MGGPEPLGAGVLEEGGQLGSGPGSSGDGVRSWESGVGAVGDVAVDKAAFGRCVECGSHDHVDFEHGLGGQAVA